MIQSGKLVLAVTPVAIYDHDITGNDDNDNTVNMNEILAMNFRIENFFNLEREITCPSRRLTSVVKLSFMSVYLLAKLRISLSNYLKLIVEFHQYSQIRL